MSFLGLFRNKKKAMETDSETSMKQRYIQGMVLSGAGDAIGYKNGEWEFCHNGLTIFTELQKLGGLEKISVKKPKWIVSDDTVMHLATGEALVNPDCQNDREKLLLTMAQNYKSCMHDMAGRAPGNTCMSFIHYLRPLVPKGYQIKFNPRGGGCGAAMRAMCIGLRYPRPEQLKQLIAVSVESGRMSHHHPTGYLGALAAALFTSYCVQGVKVQSWGKGLMDCLPLALEYVESTGHCVKENKEAWGYFKGQWEKYLTLRCLENGKSSPVFPDKYGFAERDKFYKNVSYSGWGGSSGHDAPMIAYDAFLGADGVWSELCNRAIFHGGDSDSTGVMAACWYGICFGYHGVPPGNYRHLEYRDRLEKLGAKLYDLAYPSDELNPSQSAVSEDGTSCADVAEVDISHSSEKKRDTGEGRIMKVETDEVKGETDEVKDETGDMGDETSAVKYGTLEDISTTDEINSSDDLCSNSAQNKRGSVESDVVNYGENKMKKKEEDFSEK